MGLPAVVDLLTCPHCRSRFELADDGPGVRCAQGHRFDLARQGYLNLLGGRQPANADTPQMIDARARFLSAGFFDPVAAAAYELIQELTPEAPQAPEASTRPGTLEASSTPRETPAPSTSPEPPGARLLDAGAGTGRLLTTLLEAVPGARGIALDVSTAAARRSARAHPRLGAVVADVWQRLPVADGAIDLVISNFAPRNPGEFARVLRPAAHLLTITPTTAHLAELRRTYGLLAIQTAKAERLADSLAGSFDELATRTVQQRRRWPADVIADAIAMGPNAFHRRPERPDVTAAEVTISVELRLWRRSRTG